MIETNCERLTVKVTGKTEKLKQNRIKLYPEK
jgi:hypothetical protein